MQIHVDSNSSVPSYIQIKERIKIGLLFGELRAGDALPSLRELEQETGVGRALIHKAYLELQECGIIEMHHGKRARVSQYLRCQPAQEKMQRVESLIKQTLSSVRHLRMSSYSFAKLLLQQAREEDRKRVCYLYADVSKMLGHHIAAEIGRTWGIPIRPVLIDELKNVIALSHSQEYVVIANYYRLDALKGLEKSRGNKRRIVVVPISIRFTPDIIEQIGALPKASKVLLLAEDQEFERHGQTPFASAYEEAFGKGQLEFIVRPISGIESLAAVVKSGKYALVVVSTSIWEQLPASTRRLKRLTYPRFEVDMRSLEAARNTAGVIA